MILFANSVVLQHFIDEKLSRLLLFTALFYLSMKEEDCEFLKDAQLAYYFCAHDHFGKRFCLLLALFIVHAPVIEAHQDVFLGADERRLDRFHLTIGHFGDAQLIDAQCLFDVGLLTVHESLLQSLSGVACDKVF